MRVLKGCMPLLFLLLVACAALGLAAPQTFNQKLAYAYGTNTSVRLVAKDLLDSKAITAAEAVTVQTKADESRSALDAARSAGKVGDITTAEGKLLAAQQILGVLQTFLKDHGGNL